MANPGIPDPPDPGFLPPSPMHPPEPAGVPPCGPDDVPSMAEPLGNPGGMPPEIVPAAPGL